MDPLLEVVTEFVSRVTPVKAEAVAKRFRRLDPAVGDPDIENFVGGSGLREIATRLVDLWRESKLPGDVISGMMLGVSATFEKKAREGSLELVWTGPKTPYVPTRRTEQVLLQLIGGAKNHIFLASFVVHELPTIVLTLQEAMTRGVKVQMLLESSKGEGGSLSIDIIGKMREVLPSAEVYAWKKKDGLFAEGKVHAKIVVSDGREAFVTSANLTKYALEKNIEAGVLIHGGQLPEELAMHLEYLIKTKVVERV
ncbi:MAG: DISARM system phospholipase D-like protein DrmC [Synergistales bacterium]